MDSQLIFWCALSLLVAQRWWRRLNEHSEAEDEFESRFCRKYQPLWDYRLANDPRLMRELDRWLWCLACGVTFGNAISVKWTGLATPGELDGVFDSCACALATTPTTYPHHPLFPAAHLSPHPPLTQPWSV